MTHSDSTECANMEELMQHVVSCHQADFTTEASYGQDMLTHWVKLEHVNKHCLSKQLVETALNEYLKFIKKEGGIDFLAERNVKALMNKLNVQVQQ